MDVGLLAIGAGLAIGLAAIATGYAQARIGSAGIGALGREARIDRSRDPPHRPPRNAGHPRLRGSGHDHPAPRRLMGLDAIVHAIAWRRPPRSSARRPTPGCEWPKSSRMRARVPKSSGLAGRRNATPKPNGPWQADHESSASRHRPTPGSGRGSLFQEALTRLRSRLEAMVAGPAYEKILVALYEEALTTSRKPRSRSWSERPIRNGSSESSPNTDAAIEYRRKPRMHRGGRRRSRRRPGGSQYHRPAIEPVRTAAPPPGRPGHPRVRRPRRSLMIGYEYGNTQLGASFPTPGCRGLSEPPRRRQPRRGCGRARPWTIRTRRRAGTGTP